eukprot:gnl/MRDRNA2_/MRDRNA2_86178_c0_seq2.p1 gnl/MRDRNA2_/MRDRNA2_86178_c0~~gnl/MRDRNA2_/MRDRNA2_86178_c0_seq2.p1  ORF type:complete len:813 (-),score=175.92 gnl/MRDRNA2_/MRDRNA2_86178_c0_seq2:133-2550(-)
MSPVPHDVSRNFMPAVDGLPQRSPYQASRSTNQAQQSSHEEPYGQPYSNMDTFTRNLGPTDLERAGNSFGHGLTDIDHMPNVNDLFLSQAGSGARPALSGFQDNWIPNDVADYQLTGSRSRDVLHNPQDRLNADYNEHQQGHPGRQEARYMSGEQNQDKNFGHQRMHDPQFEQLLLQQQQEQRLLQQQQQYHERQYQQLQQLLETRFPRQQMQNLQQSNSAKQLSFQQQFAGQQMEQQQHHQPIPQRLPQKFGSNRSAGSAGNQQMAQHHDTQVPQQHPQQKIKSSRNMDPRQFSQQPHQHLVEDQFQQQQMSSSTSNLGTRGDGQRQYQQMPGLNQAPSIPSAPEQQPYAYPHAQAVPQDGSTNPTEQHNSQMMKRQAELEAQLAKQAEEIAQLKALATNVTMMQGNMQMQTQNLMQMQMQMPQREPQRMPQDDMQVGDPSTPPVNPQDEAVSSSFEVPNHRLLQEHLNMLSSLDNSNFQTYGRGDHARRPSTAASTSQTEYEDSVCGDFDQDVNDFDDPGTLPSKEHYMDEPRHVQMHGTQGQTPLFSSNEPALVSVVQWETPGGFRKPQEAATSAVPAQGLAKTSSAAASSNQGSKAAKVSSQVGKTASTLSGADVADDSPSVPGGFTFGEGGFAAMNSASQFINPGNIGTIPSGIAHADKEGSEVSEDDDKRSSKPSWADLSEAEGWSDHAASWADQTEEEMSVTGDREDDIDDLDMRTPADVLQRLVSQGANFNSPDDDDDDQVEGVHSHSRAPRKHNKGYKKAARTLSNTRSAFRQGNDNVGDEQMSNFRWGQSGDLRH